MKINIVIPYFARSAPVFNAIELANFLSQKYDVYLFILSEKNFSTIKLEKNIIVKNLFKKKFLISKIISLKKHLKENGGKKNNILFSFTISPDIVSAYLNKNCYLVSSVRGNLETNYKYSFGVFSKLIFFVHKFHLKKFDTVIAISKSMKDILEGYHLKKLIFIGNFINEKSFEKFRSLNFFQDEKKNFLFIGRFVQLKNIQEIIFVSKELSKKYKNFRVIIVGDGPIKNKLSNLINKYNLGEIIKIEPYSTNIQNYINSSDYLIMPSVSEGVSRAVLESLFLGMPCIIRNVDSASELIKHGTNGFLYADSKQLKKVIENILDQNYNIEKKPYSLLPIEYQYSQSLEKFEKLIDEIKNNLKTD